MKQLMLVSFLIAFNVKADDFSDINTLPDTAERYMSSVLFDEINTEMNDDELTIFNSCK